MKYKNLKSTFKYFFLFLWLLLASVFSRAETVEDMITRNLDLSGFNEVQKEMIRKETKAYAASIAPLYEHDIEAFKEKLAEMFIKLRDGFRIYNLARNEEVTERIARFDSLHTGIKVHVLSYVKDVYLNNLFYRLAEAYYSDYTSDYILLKYSFDKSFSSEEKLTVLPKPDIDFSPEVEFKIGQKLTEASLTASAAKPLKEEYNALSDETLAIDLAESVDQVLNRIFVEGLEGKQGEAEVLSGYVVPPLRKIKNGEITTEGIFISPAITPVKIPAGAKLADLWLDEDLYPNGSLLAFYTSDGRYYAAVFDRIMPHLFLGYYQISSTGKAVQCYPLQSDLPTGKQEVFWVERYGVTEAERSKLQNGKVVPAPSASCGIQLKKGSFTFSRTGVECGSLQRTLEIYDEPEDLVMVKGLDYEQNCDAGSQENQPASEVTRKPASNNIQHVVATRSLQGWIKGQGGNATVWLADCDEENGQVAYIDHEYSTYSSLTAEQARKKVEEGNFSTDIGIFGCYDKNTGKWKVTTRYRKGSLKINPKLKGLTEQKVADISDEYVNRIIAEKSGKGLPGMVSQKGTAEPVGEGEEFKYDNLGLFEAVIAVKDFAKTLSEEARVPEKMWNSQSNPLSYTRSPVHVPGMLAGAGDKGLEKVTDAVDMVYFGLDLATDPGKAKETWNSLKELKAEDIKEMAAGMVKEELGTENYSKGGCFARYQAGKHVVVIGTVIVGAAAHFSKIKDVIDDAGKVVKKKADDVAEGTIRAIDEIKDLLKTEKNTAFFWSGKTNGMGGEIRAWEIAENKGGSTLEALLKKQNIELPPFDPANPKIVQLWEDVSTEYAKQVSGEVRAVIGKQLDPVMFGKQKNYLY